MKKIKYIAMAMLAAALAAVNTACTDNPNEWDVNPNANGNRTWGPTDLGVEKGDTCLKIFKFNATNATSYVAQVSTVNFDSAAIDDVKEYYIGKISSSDSVLLDGLKPKTEYYLRVKACCEGKEDSQWLQYCKDGVYTVKTAALASASFGIDFKGFASGHVLKDTCIHNGAFTLLIVGSMSVDVATSEKSFDDKAFSSPACLKTGSQSASKYLQIHCSNAGTLTLYPYSGSSSTTPTITISHDGTLIKEIKDVANSGSSLPAYNVDVPAGYIDITYNSSLKVYGFKFALADDEKLVEDTVKTPRKIVPIATNDEDMTFTAFDNGANPLTWTTENMTLNAVDKQSKMSADANNSKKFAEGSSTVNRVGRLKTGASSSEGVNELTLTFKKAGTLTIYPFSGNSSVASTLVLSQNGNTLLDQKLAYSGNGTAYAVKVSAGTVTFSYPTGSVNFYGFKFVAD